MELCLLLLFQLLGDSSRFDEAVLSVDPRPHDILLIIAERFKFIHFEEVQTSTEAPIYGRSNLKSVFPVELNILGILQLSRKNFCYRYAHNLLQSLELVLES